GVVHAGDFRSVVFGKLHGKHSGTATRAVDQDLLSRLDLSLRMNPLQRNHPSLRDRRSFRERQPIGFPDDSLLGDTDIFGKPTVIRWHLPKDVIARLKLADV